MVQHFLHVSALIIRMYRIRIPMHLRSLLRRSRIDLNNTLTLTKGMRLNRGLPRVNTMMNPINLGFHLLNPKNMLTRVDIRSGPDTCHLPQMRISPLQPDTGLTNPLGLSDQDQPQHDPDPPYYREVALSDVPSLTPESLCLGPQLQLWVWMMKKAVRSSDLEVLPLCFHSAQLSKMPLISLNMILRPLIYLRVNTSNLLLPLQSGTRWDSPVMRRKYRS